jgi:hypothetical protein
MAEILNRNRHNPRWRVQLRSELITLHSDVLREEVPDRIAEVLKRLDQQKDADSA